LSSDEGFETMAAELEASGRYRVLRRLEPLIAIAPNELGTRLGLFIDLETTGLDPVRHEIIEIAMVPFNYTLDGRICGYGEPFNQLRQPSSPIPPEITALTGIDDAMVEGEVINPEDVARFAAPAALVVAHNASFDRRFAERFCDVFTAKPWACSMSEVDWAGEGFEGTRLAYLAMAQGFFYERHRAVNDCAAAIELLGRPLPKSRVTPLARMLETARKTTMRIWAEHTPFDFKDILKARGYRWNGDGNVQPRAWYVDVPQERLDAEVAYLKAEIYQRSVELRVTRITAFDRFSDRC
jgi:DNA polymerase-3 subunit epsilon